MVGVSVGALGRGQVPARRVAEQMYWMGIGSLPLVLLTAALAGIVTSQQGGYQFTGGIPLYVLGTVVTSSIVLELGPVMTAIVMIGRGGRG
jgi:phospholipid/cholesterol/gamma-HCH transport system permease protein